METATITELLRDPRSVVRKLERSSEVLIERRDADPLRLTLNSRAEADRGGTALLARVLMKVLPAIPELAQVVWGPLEEAHPWLRFLPEEDRKTFIREFAETIEACAAIGNNAALSQLLHEWKATAEIHSDPALAAVLSRRSKGTGVRVKRPTGR